MRAEMLATKNLFTVADLLSYVPFRYEDRSNVKSIAALAPGEMATVLATVQSTKLAGFQRKRLGLFEATFGDSSQAALHVKWFHGNYLTDVLPIGARVALFGKVELHRKSGELTMTQPEFEVLSGDEEGEAGLHTGRIVGIYEACGKVTTKVFRLLLDRILKQIQLPGDPLPSRIRQKLDLPDIGTALQETHSPSPNTDLRLLNAFRTPAQFRLIFEEFFWLECGLAIKKSKAKSVAGIRFEINDRVREQIKKMLPFKPTAAQKRVTQEIADDMKRGQPMNRLLQGDVGSGKTIVAAQAAVIAVENGYQVAVLAPTEILAGQHYLYFKRLFKELGYVVILLTGSVTSRDKEKLKKLVKAGHVQIMIGTHALLQQDVEFKKLGLAVADEQHRFGVMQRLSLIEKGYKPDVLVMTATPIPRTLALTLYGDLDVSVIDELPPGRKPIITKQVTQDRVEQVYSFLAQEIKAGRQAYVVYPVIEESETTAMKAAEKMFVHLSQVVFPDIPIGLLHGKMPPEQKESAMQSFQRGETKILVSTTVIEVGVDVPNATVMVIEEAERFGLAQIHQLRGRVGRGSHQSYCVLVTGKLNDIARERIRTLVKSTDGFYISEMDMKLRGPGEFFGTKQSGIPNLRIANLIRDSEILELARDEAKALAEKPFGGEDFREIIRYIQEHWQRQYGLIQVA